MSYKMSLGFCDLLFQTHIWLHPRNVKDKGGWGRGKGVEVGVITADFHCQRTLQGSSLTEK